MARRRGGARKGKNGSVLFSVKVGVKGRGVTVVGGRSVLDKSKYKKSVLDKVEVSVKDAFAERKLARMGEIHRGGLHPSIIAPSSSARTAQYMDRHPLFGHPRGIPKVKPVMSKKEIERSVVKYASELRKSNTWRPDFNHFVEHVMPKMVKLKEAELIGAANAQRAINKVARKMMRNMKGVKVVSSHRDDETYKEVVRRLVEDRMTPLSASERSIIGKDIHLEGVRALSLLEREKIELNTVRDLINYTSISLNSSNVERSTNERHAGLLTSAAVKTLQERKQTLGSEPLTKRVDETVRFARSVIKKYGIKRLYTNRGDVFRLDDGQVNWKYYDELFRKVNAQYAKRQREYRRRQRKTLPRLVPATASRQAGQLFMLAQEKLTTKLWLKYSTVMEQVQRDSMKKVRELVAWNNLTGNAITGLMSLITFPRPMAKHHNYPMMQVPGLRRKRATRKKISKGHYSENGGYRGEFYDKPGTYFTISPERGEAFMETNEHYAYNDARNMLDKVAKAVDSLETQSNNISITFVSGAEYITQLKTNGGVDIIETVKEYAVEEIKRRLKLRL